MKFIAVLAIINKNIIAKYIKYLTLQALNPSFNN